MANLVYRVVRHGDGWAYSVGETLSETFLNHGIALAAAKEAVQKHQQSGSTVGISLEDQSGHWHDELSDGNDRPTVTVEDGS